MIEGTEQDVDRRFVKRLLLALLIIGIVLLLWELQIILVLAFGAILLGILWHAAARWLHKRVHIPQELSLAIIIVAVFLIFGGVLFLFGSEISRQTEAIAATLPDAVSQLREKAQSLGLGTWFDQQSGRLTEALTKGERLGGMLMTIGNSLTDFVVVVVGSIFLAARPSLYRSGLIKLVPPARRNEANSTLGDIERALRLWFKGRLVAMLGVGLITGVGLWIIGVPSFLALGILAGLLEIIPFIGPILAAVPAILLALLIGPTEALLVLALYFVVQQAEGNLITPIIQKHAVDLPPAILLFSLLAFGFLFGFVGVLLAAPMTVVLFIAVKKLYVREALDTPTSIPGEDS